MSMNLGNDQGRDSNAARWSSTTSVTDHSQAGLTASFSWHDDCISFKADEPLPAREVVS